MSNQPTQDADLLAAQQRIAQIDDAVVVSDEKLAQLFGEMFEALAEAEDALDEAEADLEEAVHEAQGEMDGALLDVIEGLEQEE